MRRTLELKLSEYQIIAEGILSDITDELLEWLNDNTYLIAKRPEKSLIKLLNELKSDETILSFDQHKLQQILHSDLYDLEQYTLSELMAMAIDIK
ncbi:MAG UNVERIFIED_CONTAM: hypothetical protein LVQ98_06790 [Rickettsiaceae bacterium]|jgi:hypothetical protein